MNITMIGASGFVSTRLIDLLKLESEKYNLKIMICFPVISSTTLQRLEMCVSNSRWTRKREALILLYCLRRSTMKMSLLHRCIMTRTWVA